MMGSITTFSFSNPYNSRSSDKNYLWIRRTVLLFTISMIVCLSDALSQSHEGSATTNDYTINKTSPDLRIQIQTTNGVHVLKVQLPRATVSSLERGIESNWKVSLELLSMQLCEFNNSINVDRLKAVYSDPSTIIVHTWKKNVSYSDIPSSEEFEGLPEETRELKSIQTNQIVLIPEGRWRMSGVDLIATLYQDPDVNGNCSTNTFPCMCDNPNPDDSLEDEADPIVVTRCIPESLLCNGQPNCGSGCRYDESEEFCTTRVISPVSQIKKCEDGKDDTQDSEAPPLKESGSSIAAVQNANTLLAVVTLITLIKIR